MKTVKKIACLITFAALLGTTAFASDGVDQEALQKLRSRIIQLVEQPDFTQYNIEDTSFKLRFMVNDKNEIVVLSTGTDNSKLDQYLKYRLNYQKVKASNVTPDMYNIKITFRNRS